MGPPRIGRPPDSPRPKRPDDADKTQGCEDAHVHGEISTPNEVAQGDGHGAASFDRETRPAAPKASREFKRPSDISRQAHALKNRLRDFEESPSKAFREFLKKFAPYQETMSRAKLAYWNSDAKTVAEIERRVKILEDYEQFLMKQEDLARRLPENLEADPDFIEMKRTNPNAAAMLEQTVSSLAGLPDTIPAEFQPKTYDEVAAASAMGRHGLEAARADEYLKRVDVREQREAQAARKKLEMDPRHQARQRLMKSAARLEVYEKILASLPQEGGAKGKTGPLKSLLDGFSEEEGKLARWMKAMAMPDSDIAAMRQNLGKDRSALDALRAKIGNSEDGVELSSADIAILRGHIQELAFHDRRLFAKGLDREMEVLPDLRVEADVWNEFKKRQSEISADMLAGKTGVAARAQKMLGELDVHALRLSIDQEIAVFSDPTTKQTVQHASSVYHLANQDWLNPRYYDEAVKILREAKRRRESGDEKGAREIYASFISSPFRSELQNYASESKNVVLIAKLGVVALSAALSGGATTALAPYLSGSAIGKVGLALAEGAMFVSAERGVSKAVTGEDFFRAKGFQENAHDIAKDVVFMSAMLPMLKVANKAARELTASLREMGADGKALAQGFEFLSEFGVFTGWEIGEGMTRGLIDGNMVVEDTQAVSLEAMKDRAIFLGGLKLGHHMVPNIAQYAQHRHFARYEKLSARRAAIARELDQMSPASRARTESLYRELVNIQHQQVGILVLRHINING